MTTQVIADLDEIISLVEAELPASPRSPRNERHAKALEKELRKYFKSLEQAFPYSRLEDIYYKHVKESAVEREAEDILEPILRLFQRDLVYRLNGHVASIYLSGSAEMITWGKTLGGIPIAYEGPPMLQAIDYASEHCAKLITQMDEETKRRLAQVISDGIKNKRGIPGLARDIKSEFAHMTRYRSEMIARTETCDALEQSFMDRAETMGVDGKEWVTFDPCEICEANEAEGIVPLDHVFSSGHVRPPAHPHCRCALAPARLAR
jgi:hypothetical protein